ncbi:DUF202 domain-containing protein [Comamonas testosteroni]|uniref:DUF202 domain-containing protein n=1 Tax=Comamonas testosteroni TaxID=285 RepID=UPI00350E41F7
MLSPSRLPTDPGLQPERTALSWTRTASGLLLNAVLNIRSAYLYESRSLLGLGIALLIASVVAFIFGRYRHRKLLTGYQCDMVVPHSATIALSATSLVASGAAILSVALHHIH